MFVSRRPDNSIYGSWTVRQHDGQEELPDDNPELLAFLAGPAPFTADELEANALSALNGGTKLIDLVKLIKAKVISDLAFRLGVAPGSLTAQQLLNERARIAAIYKAL